MTISLEELKNKLTLDKIKKYKNLVRSALKVYPDVGAAFDPEIIAKGLNNDPSEIILFYEYQKAMSLYTGALYKAIKSKKLEDTKDKQAGVMLAYSQKLVELFKEAGITDLEMSKYSGASNALEVEDLEKANFVLSLAVQEKGFDDKLGLFRNEEGFGGLSTRKSPIAKSKQKLYRGIKNLSAEQFLNILKTKRFKLDSLESWTHDQRVGFGFSESSRKLDNNYSVFFSVFNPQQYGTSVEDLSSFSGEDEVLLGGGIIRVDPYKSGKISSDLDMFSDDASTAAVGRKRNKIPKLESISEVEKYVRGLEQKKSDIKDSMFYLERYGLRNPDLIDPDEELNLPDMVALYVGGAFISDYADPEYRNRMLREQKFKVNKKLIRKLIKESIKNHILL